MGWINLPVMELGAYRQLIRSPPPEKICIKGSHCPRGAPQRNQKGSVAVLIERSVNKQIIKLVEIKLPLHFTGQPVKLIRDITATKM